MAEPTPMWGINFTVINFSGNLDSPLLLFGTHSDSKDADAYIIYNGSTHYMGTGDLTLLAYFVYFFCCLFCKLTIISQFIYFFIVSFLLHFVVAPMGKDGKDVQKGRKWLTQATHTMMTRQQVMEQELLMERHKLASTLSVVKMSKSIVLEGEAKAIEKQLYGMEVADN